MADPLATARAVKDVIGALGRGFMVSREVKAICEATGLQPWQMYFRGRCGVLGEAPADVVVAATVFFDPGRIKENWEGGRSLAADKAAELYAEACDGWGRRHYGGFAGAARLADLLEKVVNHASALGAPLFAGWRAMPPPQDAPARLARLMHVAREMRGGVHSVAVLAAGLSPLEATLAASHTGSPLGAAPGQAVAEFTLWPPPYPEISPEVQKRRERAESLTDELSAPHWAVLDDDEAAELPGLLAQARECVSG